MTNGCDNYECINPARYYHEFGGQTYYVCEEHKCSECVEIT